MYDLREVAEGDTWTTQGSGVSQISSRSLSGLVVPTKRRESKIDATLDVVLTATASYVPIVSPEDVVEDGIRLGSGSAAEVFEGRWKGSKVAVKKFHFNAYGHAGEELARNAMILQILQEARMEIATMSNQYLQAQGNICRLLGVYFITDAMASEGLLRPVLLLEQADMTLERCLKEGLFRTLEERANILCQIAHGTAALHELGIAHGDLKPSNCLLFTNQTGKLTVKVSDFGYCHAYAEGIREKADYGWGTNFWLAPECLPGASFEDQQYASQTPRDMFSLGMIMIETIFNAATLAASGWPSLGMEPSKLHEMKRSGRLCEVAESLFLKYYSLTNLQDFNNTGPIDSGVDALEKFATPISAIRDALDAGKIPIWKERMVNENFESRAVTLPLAFCSPDLFFARDPPQRARPEELRVMFRSEQSITQRQVGWVPLIARFQQREYLVLRGHSFQKQCREGRVPEEVQKSIITFLTQEAAQIEEIPGFPSSMARQDAWIFFNLSQMFRWGIATQQNLELSANYLRHAAHGGLAEARALALIRDAKSLEGGLGLDQKVLIEWTLGCLCEHLADPHADELQSLILSVDDTAAVAEFLAHTICNTYGMYAKYRMRLLSEKGSSTASPAILQADSETVHKQIEVWRDSLPQEEVDEILQQLLLEAVEDQNYALVNHLLLHENFDLKSKAAELALRFCALSGDLEGLLAFMENAVDVDALLSEEDLVNAAVVGSSILPHLQLIIQRKSRRTSSQLTTLQAEDNPIAADQELQQIKSIDEIAGAENLLGRGLLHWTIASNNWEGFSTLINLNSTDLNEIVKGRTPLHLAIQLQRPWFAACLLAKGVASGPVHEPSIPGSPEETTLLHLLCRPGIFLIKFPNHEFYQMNADGAFHTVADEDLSKGITFGSWKVLVQLLLQRGHDINAADSFGITPIRYLIRRAGSLDQIRYLVSQGASLDVPDLNGEFALHTACYNTDLPEETFRFILENSSSDVADCGSSPGLESSSPPFYIASTQAWLAACRMLLQRGARLTLKDKISFGHGSRAFLQGRYSFAPEDETADITTAMEEMLLVTTSDAMSIVIDVVAPHLNASDILGRTRLHVAAQDRDVAAVKQLIEAGALLTRADWLGFTALHVAYAVQDDAVARLLEDAQRARPAERRMMQNDAAQDEEAGASEEAAAGNGDGAVVAQHETDETEQQKETPATLSPPEVGAFFRDRPGSWERICCEAEAEMQRRAERWPDEGFVQGASVGGPIDFRTLLL